MIRSVSGISPLGTTSTAVSTDTGSSQPQAQTEDPSPDADAYTPKGSPEDSSPGIYTPGSAAERSHKEGDEIAARFLRMVRETFSKQGRLIAIAGGAHETAPETRRQAQTAIAEGGPWGAAEASHRVVSFARALAKGDPARAEELRSCFLEGFIQTAESWDGPLPDLVRQTYVVIMARFAAWAAGN